MICRECSKTLQVKPFDLITKIGDVTVVKQYQILQCDDPDHLSFSAEFLVEAEEQAALAVVYGGRCTTGATLNSVRRAFGFTQKEVAVKLGVRAETISRYETSTAKIAEIPKFAMLLTALYHKEKFQDKADNFLLKE